MKLRFSTIKEGLPLIASVMIFFSIIKAIGYYYAFGVRITDYISFSDSALLFVDYILDITSRIASMTIIVLLMAVFLRNRLRGYNLSRSIIPYNLILMIQVIYLAVSIFFSVYVYLLLRNTFHFSVGYAFLYAVNFVLVFGVWLYYIFGGYKSKVEEYSRQDDRVLVYYKGLLSQVFTWLVVAALAGGTLQNLYLAIKKIPATNTEKQFVYYFSDSSIVFSGIDTMYIGRTKDNIFFYINSQKKALVLKEDAVKKSEIRILKINPPDFSVF
jgi:hypothetical protein